MENTVAPATAELEVATQTESGQPSVQTSQDPAEAAARAMGWRPKEEFSGSSEKWVDAGEFVRRKPLFDEVKDLKRTVKKMADTNEAMAKHFQKTVAATVESRIAQLNAGRDEAIAEGNVTKVKEFDAAIEAQRKAKSESARPGVDPDVTTWQAENPWFGTDKEMRVFAIAANDAYLRNNPDATTMDGLDSTLKAVKKAFPEKFASAKPPAPPSPSSAAPPATAQKKYSVSRLSREQRLAHDQYIKAGTFDKAAKAAGISSTEYFMKSLEQIGELP